MRTDDGIGIIVATHGGLAESLVRTAELILGPRSGTARIKPFEFSDDEKPQDASQRLQALVRRADGGRGVVILVDLFGGTPGSLALSMLNEPGLGVITGVNLPMVMTAAGLDPALSLEQATQRLENAGRNAIRSAGQLLKSG